MHRLPAVLLIVAGVIHLLPLPGVLGAPQLARLYGVPIDDPNLLILMRHRAVLFGLLGVALIAAAFKPEWRSAVLVAGLVSAGSFVLLAWQVDGYNALIGRVVVADVIAVACLLLALALHWRGASPR